MEPRKVDETKRASEETLKVVEMGRVSEETKGTNLPNGESTMQPTTHN